MRHRFFFVWTLVFQVVLAGLFLTGMFQSYDKDGPQILTLFFVCNYYVVSLQVLWRFSHGQMSAVSQAVRDIKDDIREGVIKSVDQSGTLNASSGDIARLGEGEGTRENVVLVSRSASQGSYERDDDDLLKGDDGDHFGQDMVTAQDVNNTQ